MSWHSRFWVDYTSEQFSRLPRESLIAVLPVGAVEQHGPHMPISTDLATIDGVVAAVAPRSSKMLSLSESRSTTNAM